ncbi:LPS export ABC transporter periplasmic protein LptC [Dokdonia sp. PRO95]|uniref:LPS export ABC transporter periplasmic protein LptC n=1 Tax=Dokdonia sp. PRO95 TaxID=1239415 RepID=UPI000550CA1F|nr:LPS export ABC transporter periplasmic protein LptC [Dokdonia sp. PRO95]
MYFQHRHILKFLVTAFAVTLFLSCGDKGEEIRKMSIKSDGPVTEGRGINLKYTDSGKVTAHLKTPYIKNYANSSFPYEEFPEGVEVIFIDDNKENVITSDYAIRYKSTNLIDLQRNVTLVTSDSITLKAEQLYWDQTNNWIFTDQPYTIITKDGSRNDGDLFDSNEDFTNFVSLNNVSKQYVKENNEDL